MIDPEFDTIRLIVTSDRIANAPGNYLWHIVGRSLGDVEQEANKIHGAACQGFAAFTRPRHLSAGPFEGWFEVSGIVHDMSSA
jgi:hypothetical protein